MSETPVEFPIGYEYLAEVAKLENGCQTFTSESLDSMGEKAPKCMETLGTVLSFGERVACCFWNCPGKGYEPHMIQYIAGRANSYGRAAIRLMLMGFYDEALSLVRSLGEIANLFLLFELDSQKLADWKISDANARRDRFRPVQIRKRIASKGSHVPMNDKKYGLFCELTTHPVPELRPQNYNFDGRAMTGGYFQEAGFFTAMNETAAIESMIVILASKLCGVPEEHRREIRKACLECLNQTGAAGVESLPDFWSKMRAETNKANESDAK